MKNIKIIYGLMVLIMVSLFYTKISKAQLATNPLAVGDVGYTTSTITGIGIGTFTGNISSALHVNTNLTAAQTGGGAFNLGQVFRTSGPSGVDHQWRMFSDNSSFNTEKFNVTNPSGSDAIELASPNGAMRFITTGTQRMCITPSGSSGFIGIGAGFNAPKSRLHINQGGSGNDVQLQMTTDATGNSNATDGLGIKIIDNTKNVEFKQYENADMLFYTNSAEAMRIINTGAVGIGISAPQSLLHQHVSGNNATYHTFTSGRSGTASTDGFKIGITDRNNAPEADIIQQENAAIRFWTTPSGAPLERVTILANGNVGVGTASPSSQLHVIQGSGVPYAVYAENNNAATTTGQTETVRALNNVSRSGGSDFNRAGYFEAANAAAGNTGIYVSAASVTSDDNHAGYFLADAGDLNVGIEARATNSSLAGTDLANYGLVGLASNAVNNNYGVRGVASGDDADNYAVQGIASGSSGTGASVYGVYGTASGGDNNYAIYGDMGGGTTQWAGYFNGAVFTTTNLTVSDNNLKTNVQDLSNGLAIINQLSPKTFEYKTQQQLNSSLNLPSGDHAGLIAQDLESVLPELVSTVVQPAKYDDAGNEIYPSLSFKAVNYTELIPYLIQAIKEQQAQIDALNAPVAPTPRNKMQKINIKLENEQGSVLYQNKPNPFSSSTTINYYIPEGSGRAVISFYNNKGNLMKEVEITQKGQGTVEVNAENLGSDIYTYSLIVDGKVIDTKKMVKTR